MSIDQFSSPASMSDFRLADALGLLILVKPTEFREQIETAHGPTDAVAADVVILDGDRAGDEIDDALIFGKVVINQVKRSIGGMVLGRVSQGVKQKGKNAPWQLSDPTDADKDVARAYLAKASTPPF